MISPVLTLPSRAVVEVHTKEASDGQITESTTVDDLANIDFGLIHALTGPIYVVRRGSGVSSANGPAVADRPAAARVALTRDCRRAESDESDSLHKNPESPIGGCLRASASEAGNR